MENFKKVIFSQFQPNDDMFKIGYYMVQYFMDKHNLNDKLYDEVISTLDEIDDRLTFIIMWKNLVSQVNNGGFAQYFYNGYANSNHRDDNDDLDNHHYLIKLFEKYVPKNDNTQKILNILYNFVDSVYADDCENCGGSGYCEDEVECGNCDGNGYVDEEECCECGGRGYIVKEYPCDDCHGSGRSPYFSYHGDDDEKFYDTMNEEMDKLFRGMFIHWIVNWDKDCSLNQFHGREQDKNSKPKLQLVGTDGNAFSILGRFVDCLRYNGYKKEQLDEIKKECTSGDYDHLLATVAKYCEIY